MLSQSTVVWTVFAMYALGTIVYWWRNATDAMYERLHSSAGVLAAFVPLLLNSCAIDAQERKLQDYLDRAAVHGYYDDDWTIYLELEGDSGFVRPQVVSITPTFYKKGRLPVPTHTGSPVDFYAGEFDVPAGTRTIVINNADESLCERQVDSAQCKDMHLIHVRASLGDLPPILITRKVDGDTD